MVMQAILSRNMLMEYGAGTLAKDDDRQTALQLAERNMKGDLVVLLKGDIWLSKGDWN